VIALRIIAFILLGPVLSLHGMCVLNPTVAGTSVLHPALIAPSLVSLGAGLVLLVTDSVAMSDPDPASSVWAYDQAVAGEVFSPAEIMLDPLFHLRGAVQQSNVLARHRQAL
jgi:hypothetical protein